MKNNEYINLKDLNFTQRMAAKMMIRQDKSDADFYDRPYEPLTKQEYNSRIDSIGDKVKDFKKNVKKFTLGSACVMLATYGGAKIIGSINENKANDDKAIVYVDENYTTIFSGDDLSNPIYLSNSDAADYISNLRENGVDVEYSDSIDYGFNSTMDNEDIEVLDNMSNDEIDYVYNSMSNEIEKDSIENDDFDINK